MIRSHIKIMLLIMAIFILSSCATAKVEKPEPKPLPELRVGVTTDYPPVIFRQGKEITGIEADLALLFAAELGKTVKFIELRWEDQIPALIAGKTDIIMSGMSITNARKVRVNFSDHYLKSGLMPMMHVENARKYNSIERIKQNYLTIGVQKGTTGEIFVRENFPNAVRIASFQKASDAPTPLKNRSIDIFVHDAPSIMWLVSENEAELTALWEPLNEEDLAWGVRKNDPELLMTVNSILNKWKKDGTLDQILGKWLPAQYLERFQ
jgi:polar amino acid transport system substrate-binding protein